MLKKFLLGRGLNKAQEIASKFLRHGLGVAGGWLLANEYATNGDIASLEGGAVTLLAIGLSVARTFLSARV